jgi:hypothetical protein
MHAVDVCGVPGYQPELTCTGVWPATEPAIGVRADARYFIR